MQWWPRTWPEVEEEDDQEGRAERRTRAEAHETKAAAVLGARAAASRASTESPSRDSRQPGVSSGKKLKTAQDRLSAIRKRIQAALTGKVESPEPAPAEIGPGIPRVRVTTKNEAASPTAVPPPDNPNPKRKRKLSAPKESPSCVSNAPLPYCAGWVSAETDKCVECGQPFPSYPLPCVLEDEEGEEVLTCRFTRANLTPPKPPASEPKAFGPVHRVGPDFLELLREGS